MSGHVAIFVFPDFGHFNPTLPIAKHLVERGHRVTYVVDSMYSAAVSSVGAALAGYTSVRRRLSTASHVESAEIAELGLDILADANTRVIPAARAAFTDDRPDLIVYDFESFVPARILAREWGTKTLQYFPYTASNDHFSLHAETMDRDSDYVHKGVEAILEILAEVEPDPAKMWAMMAVADEHNLVFLPRALQPHGETFDEKFTFLGHCLPSTPPPVSWTAPSDDVPVALISMGTESNERTGMFQLCADAFADKTWHVVMTLGRGNALDDGVSAVNVEAHEWMPHLAVLPRASVFVTHGGMGSLVEALYHGCPCVVVPHTPENTVNAKRVHELGIGRYLPASNLDPATLRAAVDELTTDPDVLARVAAMSAAMQAGGGPSEGADVIERLLTAPTG
ncbi:macrolide family glycosyltransferase [Dactylosporangium sp. NPDC050588]|uniref:macrolide family glycosyltransferase n=1 Tax=Dactylosporangium sp. NPDC050588 TaxID=3157211 RepID=UPI00340F0885